MRNYTAVNQKSSEANHPIIPFEMDYKTNQLKINALKKSLIETNKQLCSIQNELSCGMISSPTAEAKVNILKKEIKEKKKRLIAEVHVGKRGNPLSMGKYNANRKLYIVKCADGKQLTSVTEDGLLDALMAYYGLSLNSPLVKDIYDRAIARYAKKHPGKDMTVQNYGYDYNRFITEELETKDIRKITKDYLEDYTIALAKSHIKSAALKAFKTLLNLIYDQAIFEGLVNQNIAKDVKIKSLFQYCDQTLAHRKPIDVLYSKSEDNAIVEYMRKEIEKKPYSPFAFMALLQKEFGCRPDEIICLDWNDFDIENELVSFERQQIEHRKPVRWFEIVPYLKNEKNESIGGRLVPLSPRAIALYNELKEIKKREGIESNWLFTKEDGTLLRKSDYSDFLRNTCKSLGINSKGSYAFRRGLSAKMESKGIPASERALVLGHSVETNLKNYTFAQVDYLNRVRVAMK